MQLHSCEMQLLKNFFFLRILIFVFWLIKELKIEKGCWTIIHYIAHEVRLLKPCLFYYYYSGWINKQCNSTVQFVNSLINAWRANNSKLSLRNHKVLIGTNTCTLKTKSKQKKVADMTLVWPGHRGYATAVGTNSLTVQVIRPSKDTFNRRKPDNWKQLFYNRKHDEACSV